MNRGCPKAFPNMEEVVGRLFHFCEIFFDFDDNQESDCTCTYYTSNEGFNKW